MKLNLGTSNGNGMDNNRRASHANNSNNKRIVYVTDKMKK